jgi:hypothetical protein
MTGTLSRKVSGGCSRMSEERIGDRAHIYGLLYDGMDLPARWKRRKKMKISKDE